MKTILSACLAGLLGASCVVRVPDEQSGEEAEEQAPPPAQVEARR